MKKLALVSLAALATAQAAHAQDTNITPDTAAGLTLGTTVTPSGTTHTIDGGTVSGTNLFHSFSTFDLGQGDIAQWIYSAGDPTSLSTVVNRVTGGTPSSILGNLDSTAIPNADFYFINPAGIVFGSGAQVNVPAAAHFSTASELNFEDGRTFQIATPSGSTLSVAAPEAFGFLGNEGTIAVTGTDLIVGGGPLSLSASHIDVQESYLQGNGVLLSAIGNTAAQVSLDGHASVQPTGLISIIDSLVYTGAPDAFSQNHGMRLTGGDIAVEFSTLASLAGLDFGSGAGGDILLDAAGSVLISNSGVRADTFGASAAGFISIHAGETISVADSNVFSDTYDIGPAGAVSLFARDIFLDSSWITSESLSTGLAGSVGIHATEDLAVDFTTVSSAGFGDGAGTVFLSGTNVMIVDSDITSDSVESGAAGAVIIEASTAEGTGSLVILDSGLWADNGSVLLNATGNVTIDGSFLAADNFGTERRGISITGADVNVSSTDITSDRAAIVIDASGSLSVADESFFTANGGIVWLNAQADLELSDTTIFADGDSSLFGSDGQPEAGAVLMNAANIDIQSSWITAENFSDVSGGQASGLIAIEAQNGLTIAADTTISLDTFGDGDAGLLLLSGRNILVDNSIVSSSTLGRGNAGFVEMRADRITLSNGSEVESASFGEGAGGSVTIIADFVELTDGSSITSEAWRDGDAGFVSIEVADLLSISGGSFISSNSGIFGNPDALGWSGNISIFAGSLSIDSGSITSTAFASGNSGSIDLQVADDVTIFAGSISSNARTGDAGSVFVAAGTAELSFGTISSDAFGGDGGDVDISIAGDLTLADSLITTNAGEGFASSDTGSGGNVSLAARSLTMDGSDIASRAIGQGSGGTVSIQLDGPLTMFQSNIYTDTHGGGDAGDISIHASEASLDFSRISSDSFGDGFGGLVSLFLAGELSAANGSYISSDSLGTGDAGGVQIEAGSIHLDAASISSDAWGSGNGGVTQVAVAGELSLIGGAFISSDSLQTGDAGGAFVIAGSAVIDGGYISSDAYGSGNGGLTSVETSDTLLVTGNSYISSDALGAGDGGGVFVSAGTLHLTGPAVITSDAWGNGDAGFLILETGTLQMDEGAKISSSSFGAGDALGVFINGGDVILNDSSIVSDAEASGNAGGVFMHVDQLSLDDSTIRSQAASSGLGGAIALEVADSISLVGSTIATNASGTGDAGDVEVLARLVTLFDGSAVSSDSRSPWGGQSGFVTIIADELAMSGASVVSTGSANSNRAGFVDISAGSLSLSGTGTDISSENTSEGSGDAGGISIQSDGATIADGARVSTNSANGAAGNIEVAIASGGLLQLIGVERPGIIETSSGPGTGGVITIASPLAIISNGGVISALGDSGGANVQIDALYFIASSDRLNVVQVDGTLTFSNAIYDVSAGTTDVDLSMLDASAVLQGQCGSVQATGRVSQLNIRPSGPFAAGDWPTLQTATPRTAVVGGCQ